MKRIILLDRKYYGEEISDMERDVSESLEFSNQIEIDKDGFIKGHINVTVEYVPVDFTEDK